MLEPYATVEVLPLLTERRDHVLRALREGTGYPDGQSNLLNRKLEIS